MECSSRVIFDNTFFCKKGYSMKTSIFFIFGIIGLLASEPISASPTLSPEQILRLMEASRSRYRNLEATINEQTFHKTENSPTPILQGSTSFTIRTTPERKYLYMDMRTYPDQRINKVEQYAVTAGKAKRLTLNRNGNSNSALIDQSKIMQNIHVHSVYDAIWGLQNISWNKIHQRIHTATIMVDQGLYVLEYHFTDSGKSNGLRIWIDPEKGYVPVSYATIFPDKTILSRVDSSNWKRVDNLWIPMAYTYSAPMDGFLQEFEVKSIALNRPISNDKMDFTFPEGTIVDDRLRGVKYPIPKANSLLGGSSVESMSSLTAPAGDVELANAAAKSDEMMAQQSTATIAPTGISLSPAFVWVFPGKIQYTLELSPDTKPCPTLSGKSISDSPLVLHGVDDQLAASGKLIVTLERPAGHKAFADAVLTLDFAGTKVPIHFVAAPLSE
jgi:hypothetical protein